MWVEARSIISSAINSADELIKYDLYVDYVVAVVWKLILFSLSPNV